MTTPHRTTPFEGTLADLFAKQARSTPNRPALRFCDTALTFAQLDGWSDETARRLRSEGIGVGQLVGLSVDRSPAVIAALLGVLKVGAAYVALDPELPMHRRKQLLADASPDVLLHAPGLQDQLGSSVVAIEVPALGAVSGCEEDRAQVSNDALFHVVYTSGTTGRPKGVRVTHGSVRNRLEWMWRDYPFSPDSTMCIYKSCALVASPWEMLGGLLRGICSVLLTREQILDPVQLHAIVQRERITHMFLTPPLIESLVDEHEKVRGDVALCLVTSGADVLPAELARRFHRVFPGVTLLNLYGMTECSSNVAAFDTAQLSGSATRVPVGRPIGGAVIRVVDAANRVLPVGVRGHVVVAGPAVAAGYHRDRELTDQRFRRDADGTVWYQTGDYGRWLRSGDLDLTGRVDNQVQIRGFRVEPEEVELALRDVAGVGDVAVAVAQQNGQVTLVGFVCGEHVDVEKLRATLLEQLPEYMVPTRFVQLTDLPVGDRGKLDRRKLAALAESVEPSPARAVDLTAMEERIAKLWQDLLGAPPASADSDFFGSGGHSLLAVRLISRMRAEFACSVPLSLVFQDSTLRGLAAAMEARVAPASASDCPTSSREAPLTARPPSDAAPLSFQQQLSWDVLRDHTMGLGNVSYALRLTGGLNVEALCTSVEALAERHETLRARIVVAGGVPQQWIDRRCRLTTSTLAETPKHEVEERLTRLVGEYAENRIDPTVGPAFKTHLFELSERDHVLVLAIEHLFADGFSMAVVLRDLPRLYRQALHEKNAASLPAPPLQYADYAVWQRKNHDHWMTHHYPYWSARLSDAKRLAFPKDPSITGVAPFTSSAIRINFGAQLNHRLRVLAQREKTTMPFCLFAAFAATAARWGNTNDFVFPFCVMGRHTAELEDTVGYFVHLLYLRIELAGATTFRDVLRRVLKEYAASAEHIDFGRVQAMMPQFVRTGWFQWNPAFIDNFDVETFGDGVWADRVATRSFGAGWTGISHIAPRQLPENFMMLSETADSIVGTWCYRADLFKASTMESFLQAYEQLCRAFAEDPDSPIDAAFPAKDYAVEDVMARTIVDDASRGQQQRPADHGASPRSNSSAALVASTLSLPSMSAPESASRR